MVGVVKALLTEETPILHIGLIGQPERVVQVDGKCDLRGKPLDNIVTLGQSFHGRRWLSVLLHVS